MSRNILSAELSMSDETWDAIEVASAQLVERLKSGEEASLAQFAPSLDSPIHNVVVAELIKIHLEHRWKEGRGKRVEEYLREWPELIDDPELVRDLVESECLTRTLFTADEPTRGEIDSRFPGMAEKIDWGFIEGELETGRYRQSMSRVGKRFGPKDRYDIRDLLGQGGMGTVYRAYDSQLDREVALKIPFLDSHLKHSVLDRFLREARAAAKIRHENVCRIYDADQHGESYYLTMDLIEGQSLLQWVDSQRKSTEHAVTTAMKLARALAAVHEKCILHRDIKPSNVMIDEKGEPWLMDFGLAGQTIEEFSAMLPPNEDAALKFSESRLTQSKTLLGTVPYMGPELFRGEKASPQSDIYSLGVLLYELLTGRHPFVTEASGQFTLQSLQSDPTPMRTLRAEVDAKLEAICLKALAKVPSERFASAEEMADELQRYLESTTKPVKRPPIKLRTLVLLAVIFLAAACFAGILIYLKTGEGTLQIVVNESDAQVTLDEKTLKIENGKTVIVVPLGEHRIEASKKGFNTSNKPISLDWRGERVEINIELEGKYIARWINIDNTLSGMAVAHNRADLFVASNDNPNSSCVQAIDAKTGKIRQSIVSPKGFRDYKYIASSRDDRFLFVTNYSRELPGLTRIDRLDPEAQQDLENGGIPWYIPWNRTMGVTPDGKRLLVATGCDGRDKDDNPRDNQLAIVDIEDGRFALLGTVLVEDEPGDCPFVFSSDSRFLYLLSFARKPKPPMIYEVDLSSPYKVTRKLEFSGSRLTGLAISSKRKRIYVSDADQKMIHIVDLETFRTTGDWRIKADSKGRKDSGKVEKIAADTENSEAPAALAVDPAENTLAVLCPTTRKTTFLDLEDGEFLGTVSGLRENAFDLKFSKNGDDLFVAHSGPKPCVAVVDAKSLLIPSRIVFSSNRAGKGYQLFVMGLDGKNIRPLLRSQGNDCFPRWSPNGRKIAYISDKAGPYKIFIAKRNGEPDTYLEKADPIGAAPLGGYGSLLDWSPDGSRIVFIGSGEWGRNIRTVDVKTGEVQTIFSGGVEVKYTQHIGIQWDRLDGTILFVSATNASGNDRGIFRLDPKTGQVRPIFRPDNQTFFYCAAAISPDGKKIAVYRQETDVHSKQQFLYLLGPDGSNPRQLANTGETSNFALQWTADDKAIVYVGQKYNRSHIYMVRLPDGEPVQLTDRDWNDINRDRDDINPDVWGEVEEEK